MDTPTCANPQCNKPMGGRNPAERRQRKYCSNACVGASMRKDRTKGTVGKRTLEVIEDVKWIVDHDHPVSVAKRVGYSTVESLTTTLRRAGEFELAMKIESRL